MEPISQLLKRFQKMVVMSQSTQDAFRDACELVLKNDIGFFSLSIKGDKVFVRATSTTKNAILINQKKILSEFKIRSGLSFSEIK